MQLEAAVAAFADMSARMGREERVFRQDYHRDLASRFSRRPSTFKYIFFVIAGVLKRLHLTGIPGVTSTAFASQETEDVIREAVLRTPYFTAFGVPFLQPSPSTSPPLLDTPLPSSGTPPLPPGNAKPPRYKKTVIRIVRDQAVVDWVLAQANGHCENCGLPAPFLRGDGTPYLEVHHVT